MHRRELLTGAVTVAALASAAAATGAGPSATTPAADPHAGHDAGASPLYDAAQDCVRAAQLCQAHCRKLLLAGDRSLADCFESVTTLLPVCETLAALATQRTTFLPRYARLAADVCRACEKECRKHENEHAVCRDCAEACARCAQQCERVAA